MFLKYNFKDKNNNDIEYNYEIDPYYDLTENEKFEILMDHMNYDYYLYKPVREIMNLYCDWKDVATTIEKECSNNHILLDIFKEDAKMYFEGEFL